MHPQEDDAPSPSELHPIAPPPSPNLEAREMGNEKAVDSAVDSVVDSMGDLVVEESEEARACRELLKSLPRHYVTRGARPKKLSDVSRMIVRAALAHARRPRARHHIYKRFRGELKY